MPGWFLKHGFLTVASGKLYHGGSPPNNDYQPDSACDDPPCGSWSEPVWGNGPPIGDAGGCSKTDPQTRANIQTAYVQDLAQDGKWEGRTWTCTDIDDEASLNDHDNKTLAQGSPAQLVEYDHRLATRTIERLAEAKASARPVHSLSESAPLFQRKMTKPSLHPCRPLFVGCGLRRPHLAWRMPTRFWALYANTSNFSIPANGPSKIYRLGLCGARSQRRGLMRGGSVAALYTSVLKRSLGHMAPKIPSFLLSQAISRRTSRPWRWA